MIRQMRELSLAVIECRYAVVCGCVCVCVLATVTEGGVWKAGGPVTGGCRRTCGPARRSNGPAAVLYPRGLPATDYFLLRCVFLSASTFGVIAVRLDCPRLPDEEERLSLFSLGNHRGTRCVATSLWVKTIAPGP